MMLVSIRPIAKIAALLLLGLLSSCGDKEVSPEKAAIAAGKDLIIVAIEKYRLQVRADFSSRNFAALEETAEHARVSKERFKDGTWKLAHFHDAFGYPMDAPEAAWLEQEKGHREWITAYPESIAAHVAQAEFLIQYGWLARGTAFINEVSEEALRLQKERFAMARTVLEKAAALPKRSPAYGAKLMDLALAQEWTKPEFAVIFEEAKALEPQYIKHDLAQARFLMPRYQGSEGDWEAAAEKEILREGGLGEESYARVMMDQRGYYDDFFAETKASWSITQSGFELMRKRYPESLEILNAYCRLACIAEDRATARRLFIEIDNRVTLSQWGERKRFNLLRRWSEQ